MEAKNNKTPVLPLLYKDTRGKKVKISQFIPFDKHPFNMPDRESPEMQKLVSSIATEGLLNLPIVRRVTQATSVISEPANTEIAPEDATAGQIADAAMTTTADTAKDMAEIYQIVCGHRRIEACKIIGFEEIPVRIVEFADDDDATLTMISSNIQREKIEFSEKVRACSMMYETKKHQGKSKGNDKSTRHYVGKVWNTSSTSIGRFVILSRLSDELLNLIGKKRLTSAAALEIVKMSEEMKKVLTEILLEYKYVKPTLKQIKEILEKGEMTKEELLVFLRKDQRDIDEQAAEKKQKFAIKFSLDDVKKIFPDAGKLSELTEDKLRELIFEKLGIKQEFTQKLLQEHQKECQAETKAVEVTTAAEGKMEADRIPVESNL